MQDNANSRLTTHFDTYETLITLLDLAKGGDILYNSSGTNVPAKGLLKLLFSSLVVGILLNYDLLCELAFPNELVYKRNEF